LAKGRRREYGEGCHGKKYFLHIMLVLVMHKST